MNVTSRRKKFIRGATYLTGCNVLAQLLNFYAIIYICNIISPVEYALFGIGMIFFGFLEFFSDLGMGAAIVQKKEVKKEDLNAVFLSILLFSVLLATSGFFLAGGLERFFGKEGVAEIFRFFSLVVMVKGLSVISHGLLLRNLRFHIKAVVELVSKAASIGLSLLLVNLGFGVWSLIYAQGFNYFLQTVLLFCSQPYRPGITLQSESFKPLLGFSVNIIGLRFVWYFRNTIDKVIGGRILTGSDFGLYSFSFNLAKHVQKIIGLVVNVLSLPGLAKIQDDPERLRTGYLQIVKALSIVSLPIFVGGALCAGDMVRLFFGPKWHGAIAVFQLACLIQIVKLLNITNDNIFVAIGKPSLPLKVNIGSFLLLLAALLAGSRFGIKGIIAGILIILTCHCAFWTRYVLHHFSIPSRAYLGSLSSSVMGTLLILPVWLLAGACFRVESNMGPLLALKVACEISLSALLYSLVIFLREPELVTLLKQSRSNR